ncbi:MAG TPA: hypothetical protein VF187_03290 [Gemmatimonadales bacterium]
MTTVARALLGGAIDYAGLFPPAGLDLEAAVANFMAYRRSSESWALGRLVVPASALDRLADLAGSRDMGDGLRISAVIGPAVGDDVERVRRFDRSATSARLDAVEARAGTPAEARTLHAELPDGWTRYVEVPLEDGFDSTLGVLAAAGTHAKIRTGGVTPEAFPDAGRVAEFLHAAATRRLAFKATAGLHHPLRGRYRLTYAPEAPTGVMYGYLNLSLAALSAWLGLPPARTRAALLETDPASLGRDGEVLRWRDLRFEPDQIEAMRRDFFHGFGSCSFREPLDEWPLGAAA